MLPEQLTLFSENSYVVEPSRFSSAVIKNDSLSNKCTDSISTSKYSNHVDSESKCTNHGVINIYSSGGTSRGKKKYYRYSWREKNRMIHIHIPGGNIDSISAKKRAALVQCEIDNGRSPVEIVEFIKSFGRHA